MTTDPAPHSPPRGLVDWENLIAGRWLFGAGLALVLLGTAYFLNLAFGNHWVNPFERVALGLAGGTLLIVAGEFFWRRERVAYANGLTGLGSAMLFLSLYAGYAIFSLMPAVVAFGAMLVVTTGLCAIAYRRSSLTLALLGLAGAVLSPMLAGQTVVRYSEIAAYLALVASGMLVLATAKRWVALEVSAFAAVVAYSPFIIAWTLEPAHGVAHWEALAAATVMFAPFASVWFVRALRRGIEPNLRAAILFSSAWFITLIEYALNGMNAELAVSLLAFATLALVAEYTTRRKLYAWTAVAAVTSAVPAIFHHGAISGAWALEAMILVALGARTADPVLRIAGYAALGLAMAWITQLPAHAGVPFFNDRFISLALIAAALGFISSQLRAFGAMVSSVETRAVIPAHVLAATLAVIAATLEIRDYGAGNGAAISLTWTACAAILVAAGARSRSWLLRWEGLALFAIAIAKVGLVDLASLELTYRVISTLGLGSVLVAVAAWYQRRPAIAEEES